MKKGILGGVLLGAILLLSLSWAKMADERIAPVEQLMEQAAQASLREDWQKTAALTGEARAAWEDSKELLGCLGDQQSVREIRSLYDEMEIFRQAEEACHCSAACRQIKNHLQALREDQLVKFPDLL